MNIEKTHTSLDKHNTWKLYMSEVCITNTVFICNGRTGEDKSKGSITCIKGNSVIDYFLCTQDILGNVGI